MILKRSAIKHVAALSALILSMGMTACSSDDNEPAQRPSGKEPESVALTVPLSSAATGDDTSPLMSSMCIATYDEKGHLIETIYKDGEFVKERSHKSSFDHVYELNGYGTVMSVELPMETYKEYTSREIGEHYGIKFAAFYLPESSTSFQETPDGADGFVVPDNLNKLNSEIESYYTLNFPTTTQGVWVPEDDNQIPMAGVLDITEAVKTYDPVLWGKNNPMFLNNDPLVLIRSMAKVTIVNGNEETGQFLTGAKFKTAAKGSLLPELDKIIVEGSDTKVNEVTLPNLMSESWQTDAQAENEYVFYTFERDLSGDNDKKLIEVSWEGHGSKTIEFKPTNIADQVKSEWQGILRNHNYKFTIIKPENEEVKVKVNVDKWETFDYNEKI
ncbi:MAG: hypothetical protein K2J82_01740 [Muribaculaceae bacterium]|nr:hypothetical protein [Muribaculaceae bacterium]